MILLGFWDLEMFKARNFEISCVFVPRIYYFAIYTVKNDDLVIESWYMTKVRDMSVILWVFGDYVLVWKIWEYNI
jgi:hypothetical protein